MPVHVLLAAAAAVCSLPLLWWSVAAARHPGGSARDRLGVADLRAAILTESAGTRAVRPAARYLADRARRMTPAGWVRALDRRRILAGQPAAWPLERILVAKLLLAALGGGTGYLVFAAGPSTGRLLLWAGVGVLGYATPDLLLWSRAQERQAAIQRDLPDTLDQVTIAVEAGLGFDAALARSARSGTGPLARELTRTLQEVQLGASRADALRHLMDRTDVHDLRHLVLTLIQAEQYGIPIADVLRAQALELRTKRRQRAEEHAMKIPVKIVFPLVLCILPALFIVILGPAAIRMYHTLLGSGSV